ncbi:AraC family transcriptional regulator [Brevibacillus fluminis]|uniref:AraC family transcriptional regulator n=1 Tax=Brevibacillus fluminis TaxID=511487 RepID=A0A3M8DWD9_9BACL|nr:GyrI-like domain-containing protein [Brevibacillus fluminis]RNB92412.1 AraC family transcriptional regulator [Brevibacillus fluminis]
MKTIEARLENKPSFTVAGIKWEGTFEEAAAGGIRDVMQQVKKQAQVVTGGNEPDIHLGLSYHREPGRFIHLSAIQIEDGGQLPEGWETVTVEPTTYAVVAHQKGDDIEQSYRTLYAWIEEQGYVRSTDGLTHLEEYPFGQDPYDNQPAFTILIPVQEKK